MEEQEIKGTVIRFIPDHYQKVPAVQDLLGYYKEHQIPLNDLKALGITILDDNEREHTFYTSVSFLMNTLNQMDEPVQVRNRVAIDYVTVQDDLNVIRGLKPLPVFFKRNHAHDDDKDVPAFVRQGGRNGNTAQDLTSFNPLLPVPSNVEVKKDGTKILSDEDIKSLHDTKLSMHDAFMMTLDHSQFQQRADQMFQDAQGQAHKVIDSIFDKDYLDFTDQFNQVHDDDFVPIDDKNESADQKQQAERPHISSMDL